MLPALSLAVDPAHDDVMRREMRQLEGGWFSTSKLERSKTRLMRTGFFEDVNIETPLVAGRTDMVDVVGPYRVRSSMTDPMIGGSPARMIPAPIV